MRKVLITGSSGLVGGQAVQRFDELGWKVVGIDNNQRKEFFGEEGSTLWNLHRIAHTTKNFEHHAADIRDEGQMYDIFYPDSKKDYTGPFDAVIHLAAQPSHDKAREIPLVDHSVNATGTLMLLEMTRRHSPNAVFVFMSSSKIYGDAPNELEFAEYDTRYDWFPEEWRGFDEDTRIDQSLHSIFGANKLSADIMVQEYARTFGMKTVVFRGGCLTGPGHSSVELHGFLAYLVKCAVSGTNYNIYGYKGKQVRDNIHSYDVVRAFEEAILNPKPGSVYNLGGGRVNSVSILEAIKLIEEKLGKKMNTTYHDQARLGDHICYISDTTKFERDYPDWHLTKSIDDILNDIIGVNLKDVTSEHEATRTFDLNENSHVVDVGAFRGGWTADIVKKYNCHVSFFEPIKEYYQECVRRFRGNDKVYGYNCGLSDKKETVTLAKQGVNTSLYRGLDTGVPLPADRVLGEATPETVEFLDAVEFFDDQEIDLISINVEGSEFKLLNHLIDTGKIKKFKNVMIQFHHFVLGAEQLREQIRAKLSETHTQTFCYDWIWENWQRK